MAIPGALVISKIIRPETETSVTKGTVAIHIESESVNSIDALAHGASEGMKIGITVCAMIIAFVSLIALLNGLFYHLGQGIQALLFNNQPTLLAGLNLNDFSVTQLLGWLFYWPTVLLGVPTHEASFVASLLGTKMVVKEFVAYTQLGPHLHTMAHAVGETNPGTFYLSAKSETIATFALCGFANLSSIAAQIGGIGAMAPTRKADLAKLGFIAMIGGTLASYFSGALAGVLTAVSLNGVETAGLMVLCVAGIVIAQRSLHPVTPSTNSCPLETSTQNEAPVG
jgi:CNT family concentrative nucleoside transporter